MSEPVITLPSFAKINLFLKIGGRRDDGFHEICTAFQTVSLRDDVVFEAAETLKLESADPRLPTDEGNLVLRAARMLAESAGVRKGARIRIEKRIPFPGGLGGGSSNAAAALLGLAGLWGIAPAFEDLVALAAKLGSDVPFFLTGGTVLGTGRGTDLERLPDIPKRPLLIVTPRARYSTAEAYKSLGRDRLTSKGAETTLMVCRELAEKLISGCLEPVNDFEEAVAGIAPETGSARYGLLGNGAIRACLSGSGPSVFGIFENEIGRQAALERYADEKDLRVFAADTVTREEYREAFGPCGDLLPR